MTHTKLTLITAAGLVFGLAGVGMAQNTNSNSNSNGNSNRSNTNRNSGSNSNSNGSSSSNSNSNSRSNSNHGSDMNMGNHNMSGGSNAMGMMGGMAMLDMKFAMDAAYGNNAEIAAGAMALEKSQNSEIRAFAQMMIDHHTQANAELARMSGGAPLPSGLDPHHRAVADGMAKLSGMDFDMAYVIGQKADHAMALDLHDMISDDAKNKDLKAYGKRTEPVVKRHFEAIKAIDSRMSSSMSAMNPR